MIQSLFLFFLKKVSEKFAGMKNSLYLCNRKTKGCACSSVGRAPDS